MPVRTDADPQPEPPAAGAPTAPWTPASLLRLAPAAAIPGCALVAAVSGRTSASGWYPLSLVVAAALVSALLAGRARVLGCLQQLAVGAAALLAALSYLSLSWAGMPGASLVASNRAATYGMAIATVVLIGDSPRRRTIISGVLAGASGALAVYALGACALASDLSLFDGGRLYGPIGYPNAVTTFAAIGLWPLISVGADRAAPTWLRTGAVGLAAAVPPVVLLTVSRAGLGFVILAALVYLAASPRRVRSLPVLALVLAPTALQLATIREPYRLETTTVDAVTAAGRAGLICCLVAAVAAAAWATLDRRVETPPAVARAIRVALGACLVIAALGGIALAIERDATGVASSKWATFKAGSDAETAGGTDRYLTVGTNRYDFWRVAVLELRGRPLTGYGAANWSWPYLSLKRSTETPDNTHGSIWEFAADLGVGGLVLYLILLVAAFRAAVSPASREEWPRQAALLASLAGAVGHEQVDWLWETFPCGLLIAALTGLVLAGAKRPERRISRRVRRIAVAGTIVVALVAVLPALLAERYTDQSYGVNAAAGQDAASLAASLNPFAAAPLVALSRARLAAGDQAGAAQALRDAVAREPKRWSTWVGLAQIERSLGATESAIAACRTAAAIKPDVVC